MEGKPLVVAKMVTLVIALVGLCVMIYGWFQTKTDAPIVLSGFIFGLILSILGFSKATPKPDPTRIDETSPSKEDDVMKKEAPDVR